MAQVSCSKLDLRLTSSESILKWPGSQEAAQPGPLTQEAENTCEVLQHKGLALPNPGAGLTAQASLPRGISSQPRSAQGDVEARRGWSPSPGASAGSATSLIQAWGPPPSFAVGSAPPQCRNTTAQAAHGDLPHPTPVHHAQGAVQQPLVLCCHLSWSRCHRHHPISQVRLWKHSPRLHWHLAKPLSPGVSISSSALWHLFRKWGW